MTIFIKLANVLHLLWHHSDYPYGYGSFVHIAHSLGRPNSAVRWIGLNRGFSKRILLHANH